MTDQIQYSDRYSDDTNEYRYVILPTSFRTTGKLYNETEWRSMGIQMSKGWVHIGYHPPNSRFLIFKRPKSS